MIRCVIAMGLFAGESYDEVMRRSVAVHGVNAVTVQDIDTWDTDLPALTDGLRWLFTRPEPKETFGLFVRAMLADVAKKELLGDGGVRGLGERARYSTG